MSKCPNCSANLSCGCQKRTASNGASGCTACISSLESKLKNNKSTVQKSNISQSWGANRYNNK